MQFLLGGTPSLKIEIAGLAKRKHLTLRYDSKNEPVKYPIFSHGDSISGSIEFKMEKCKKYEHTGIKLELIGQIETMANKSSSSSEFMSMAREIEPAGIITSDKSFPFSFNNFEKLYETYYGKTIKLRYFLRVTAHKKYGKLSDEAEFGVLLPTTVNDVDEVTPLKMEVGIEEFLHIEFQYNKGKYYLKDCVIGKVNFALVKIKLKYMQLDIIKRETIGQGSYPP